MDRSAKIVFICILMLLTGCSIFKRNSYSEADCSQFFNRNLDSLVVNFSDTSQECVRLLELASLDKNYYPEGNCYHNLDLIFCLSKHSNLLECVSQSIMNGDVEAERVLVKYLSSYYEEILLKGEYESPIPFSYLGTSRSKEAVELLHELALDNSKCTFDRHEMLDSRPLYGIGQAGIISRVRINDLALRYQDFQTEYMNYQSSFDSGRIAIRRWEEIFLPVIKNAEKEGSLRYITHSEELQFHFPSNWFY